MSFNRKKWKTNKQVSIVLNTEDNVTKYLLAKYLVNNPEVELSTLVELKESILALPKEQRFNLMMEELA